MKILVAASHRYPASGKLGSGFHPRQYPSGSGYHLHDLLAKGLAEDGHEVFYYLPNGADCPLPEGVVAVSTPVTRADIYHAPIGAPGAAEEIDEFAAREGRPRLFTCHMLEHRPAARNWVYVSRCLAKAYGSDRFILNGIDPGDFVYSEAKQDYLLFLGAMNRAIDKGLDLALALSQRKGFRLVVAGTGVNYETIQRISDLCRAAGAEYLGDVRGPQKAELLAGARALLFPSRLDEGCPLVILEAMMSGTPVLSSTGGGTVEIVTPETGFLCHQESDWDHSVDRIAEVSPARCREIALERYHYRRMVKDYAREYQREIESWRSYSARNSS
jgi:glycosyltransferase involved in cell wall biosynthesis